MSAAVSPVPRRVDLRKYPNRRYYDTSQSRHVTLDEIYAMILSGADVHVTDSKSGEDITAKVLAQIILEHDPPKLAIFPVELLHELIRANGPLIRDFVDKYFTHALEAFLESQRQFDRYLRQVLGLTTPMPAGGDWARMVMGPFASAFLADGRGQTPTSSKEGRGADVPPGAADLRRLVQELKDEIATLRKELEQRQKSGL